MIEYHGRAPRAQADARSTSSSKSSTSTFHTPALSPTLQEPLDTVASRLRLQLGAKSLAIIWHEHPGDVPRCIASSEALDLVALVGRAECEQRAREPSPQASWRWSSASSFGGIGGDRLQINVPIASGTISIVAALDTSGSREQAERIIPALALEITPFFQLCEAALTAQASSSRLKDAANLSAIGIIIVDAHATVLFANDAAERICAGSKAMRLSAETLRATTLTDSLRLQTAIEHVVNEGAHVGAKVPVLALHQARGRPIMVTVNAVREDLGGDRSAAIVCIFDSESDVAASIRPACDFYRLSAMESKLAQTLVRGHSITEAAERLGIKEHTARSYLKQTFQKTGTNRQGELVALFLRTSVHCAPNQNMSLLD